jgi:hypothetical protein
MPFFATGILGVSPTDSSQNQIMLISPRQSHHSL